MSYKNITDDNIQSKNMNCKLNPPWASIIMSIFGSILLLCTALGVGIDTNVKIFGILMIDLDIKQNKNNLNKIDTLFYDLLIILKDKNDGSTFDNNFIHDIFRFSKNIGFINLDENYKKYKRNIMNMGLYKKGKYKEYKYY